MDQNYTPVTVRVPASTSNLGPCFDVCGLALGLYVEITFEPHPYSLEFSFKGEGKEVFQAEGNNLICRAVEKLWQDFGHTPPGARISIHNSIPLYSGLGSSGAAIVAALVGSNVFSGAGFSKEQLLDIATEMEGHPDNAAPSLYGGLVLSTRVKNRIVSLSYKYPKPLMTVFFHPRIRISTHRSRELLPDNVSWDKAVFNISRAAHLAAAYATGRLEETSFAFDDQLHQNSRAQQMPYLMDALDAARKAGALGSFLSGSGPSVGALCAPERTKQIAEAFTVIQERFELEGEILILPIDEEGARIIL